MEGTHSSGDVIIAHPIFLTDDRPAEQARVLDVVAVATREAGIAA